MKHLSSLPLRDIKINDNFWNRYTKLIPEVILPYQWNILNDRVPDAPASYCLRNFRIAAKEENGERLGTVFQDSDAYKWLEAVAYSLAADPDPELEKNADEVIALLGRAQQPDGYLNTYFTCIAPENRWRNLCEGHELYCAGHLFEAAAAYYETTGKRKILDISCRFADLLCTVFGPEEGKLHGYPGHPEVELALVRLYQVTGNDTYLNLGKYFLDVRGGKPNYFLQEMSQPDFHHIFPEFRGYDPAYSQSHLPVLLQKTAEGHAVRAVYLYCAMTDIAYYYQDKQLLEQCVRLWYNVVQKRMYITGSIGSSGFLERFTVDYDLPNDSGYSETCASIGLALFGLRMARLTRDASYIDIAERALYNTVRGGIALTGDRYFYVNPLEVWPDICIENTSREHVKAVRQKWFDVACCPTNIARTFSSLGQYIYSASENELFVNLFINNKASAVIGGSTVSINTITDYPKTGHVIFEVEADSMEFTLFIRVPDFAEKLLVSVNNNSADLKIENGYCMISKVWNGKESVDFSFEIRSKLIYANPQVRASVGKAAILRGPEVYCLEEADNGTQLAALSISEGVSLREEWQEELFGGTMVVHLEGEKSLPGDNENTSYSTAPNKKEKIDLTAIPYGSWNNRTPGEMIVWLHTSK